MKKSIANFYTNSIYFFEALIKIIVLSKWNVKNNAISSKKEEVVVLANGPSLSSCLDSADFIERIEECDTVCVNYFVNTEYFDKVKPNYYVIAAPEIWIEEMYYENKAKGFVFYEDLVKKVDWELILLIPFSAKKYKFWQDILADNKMIKISYYNNASFNGSEKLINYVIAKKLGMPKLHNVLGPSILNMMWNGYKKIYLTGVDHSWLPLVSVTDDNVALVGQPHFYDKDAKPEIMKGGVKNQRKLHEILHKFYLSFKGYFNIKSYALKKDIQVINLTKGSFIDAFEKKPLSQFINKE